jgi:MYXO-CTERM domain-containing protein
VFDNPGGLDFVHDVAFDNPSAFDMLVEGGDSNHLIVNDVAFGTGAALVRFSGGTDSHNSWSLPVQASAEDFVSVAASAARAPRNADGSLPGAFMRLVEGSDLIDRGEDLGTPFVGAAPDLGAFEWGEVAAADAGVDAGGSADAGLDGAATDPDAALSGAGTGAGAAASGGQMMPEVGGAGGGIRDDAPARACACRVPGPPHSPWPAGPLALVVALLLARARRRRAL